MTRPPAVLARSVSKRYVAGLGACSATVHALRDVDLAVAPGEVLGILGGPASGKSTLLLCLAGLLAPDGGVVRWFGGTSDLGSRPPGVAYVADRLASYAFLTVREAVELSMTLRDLPVRDRRGRVDEAVALAGLGALAERRLSRLAPRLHRWVALAQALSLRPRLLLVDDTFGDADDATLERARRLLCDLASERTAVVIASADRTLLRELTSSVVRLAGGRLERPLAAPAYLPAALRAAIDARPDSAAPASVAAHVRPL